MRLISFNVNGLRSRLHQLEALIEQHQPDVIGLQETKVVDEQFPLEAVRALGYEVQFHGQKGHYGVALLSKKKPLEVFKGFPGDAADAQRRLIGARFATAKGPLTVINGYFPQGESRDHPLKFPAKEKFYADLLALLQEQYQATDPLVVMGDLNISATDLDIGIGADNAKRWLRTGKCSFLPEERAWLQKLFDWGLYDSFREQNPQEDALFSWFDYRSRGFEREPRRGLRIDSLLITRPLLECCRQTGIDYTIRAMEKPSDHAPVWAEFTL